MESIQNTTSKITQSFTFKAMIIAVLTLLLLIPNAMIQGLIYERQMQSRETIDQINKQWSLAQTVCPPVLVIPTSVIVDKLNSNGQILELFVAPESTEITVQLFPEVRKRSIYKNIVYKSDIHISGKFSELKNQTVENGVMYFDKAYILLSISDLRGIAQEIDFYFDGKKISTKADGNKMLIPLDNMMLDSKNEFLFDCTLKLKGSNRISFVPIAKNTKVSISGDWKAPEFVGDFLPDYNISANHFKAEWNVLSFNRSIPERWFDYRDIEKESSFGVNLVDMVNHYQQNMRSAKYALLFIALTFVVFFFVEVITKKRIHPIQYLLVGIALILFYSLLLSLSEQIGFALAYLIASAATILLITTYTTGIFKLKKATAILTAILVILYTFLYVILQLEDLALLIGSLGLFVILGIIMFISRKITWYK